MDLQDIIPIISLVTSFAAILGVAFMAGKLVQSVDGLQRAIQELKGVIKDLKENLRDVEQVSARNEARVKNHSKRLERLDKGR